jgi:phage gpG-like protein
LRFIAEVDGAITFDRAFNRIDSLRDLRPLWPLVIEEFYRIEMEQFESEGAAGGQRWAPLSDPYRTWKEARYPGEPILQREHDLIDSLTDPEAADAVLLPGEDELVIGTRNPTAVFHQRGTRRMPRRPPINPSEAQKRRIQKALQQGLVQFIRDAGFDVQERAA